MALIHEIKTTVGIAFVPSKHQNTKNKSGNRNQNTFQTIIDNDKEFDEKLPSNSEMNNNNNDEKKKKNR